MTNRMRGDAVQQAVAADGLRGLRSRRTAAERQDVGRTQNPVE